ncbi:MAG TPA: flagellar basal body-associated FliL family protein [Burkholderiaceae bacterium]|nr:flagellar basal body-associated FliL family protein [Burkholderiaceae bacterium]
MRVLRNFFIALLLLAVLAGAGYYYWFVYAARAAMPETTKPEAVLPAPRFFALEPFTVTLNDQRGPHILYLEITLQLVDDETESLLAMYMPEVRNRVLAELAKYEPGPIQTPEGRQNLADAFKQVLSKSYHAERSQPQIERVLFTAFVVQ